MQNLCCNLHRWLRRQDENFVTESFAFLLNVLLDRDPNLGRELIGWLCFGKDRSFPLLVGETITITVQGAVEEGQPDIWIESPVVRP